MSSNADETPPVGEAETSFSLSKSGIWLLTTHSEARVLVAIVLDPVSEVPIVTATRYATAGNGSQFNGIPMTVAVSEPPTIGERWAAEVIQMDGRQYDEEREYWQSLYVSTNVVTIEQVTFDMLERWSPTD